MPKSLTLAVEVETGILNYLQGVLVSGPLFWTRADYPCLIVEKDFILRVLKRTLSLCYGHVFTFGHCSRD